MKFKILVLLVILFCTLDARTSQRDYLHGDLDMYRFFRGYDWIVNNPKYCLITYTNKTTTKFISEDELKRYFKLKMRNFIQDIK